MPKMFNLKNDDGNLLDSKGWCPYSFITPETLNYKGVVPDKEHWGYKRWNKKSKNDLMKNLIGNKINQRK